MYLYFSSAFQYTFLCILFFYYLFCSIKYLFYTFIQTLSNKSFFFTIFQYKRITEVDFYRIYPVFRGFTLIYACSKGLVTVFIQNLGGLLEKTPILPLF